MPKKSGREWFWVLCGTTFFYFCVEKNPVPSADNTPDCWEVLISQWILGVLFVQNKPQGHPLEKLKLLVFVTSHTRSEIKYSFQILQIFRLIIIELCVCVCVSVRVWFCEYVHAFMHICRGLRYPSQLLYTLFGCDRISHWTQSISICLGWPTNELQSSSVTISPRLWL